MKNRLLIGISLLFLVMLLASCSSPTGRYISYRMSPDRVSIPNYEEISVQGPSGPVEILLDEYGVPHIRANNAYDLYFAYGYMQGRDRRFQLEVMRHLGAGKMREMIGTMDETGVMKRLEVFSRMIGLQHDAEAILQSADEQDLRLVQAFSDGVNQATKNEPIPMEFRLLDYEPKPWEPFDTMVIMALTSFGLSKNWEMELGRLEVMVHQLRTGGTIDRALQIWKTRKLWPPHLIGQAPDKDPFAHLSDVAPELRQYLEATYAASEPTTSSALRAPGAQNPLDGFFRGMSASNNWAMSGRWTGTGKSAFSSDPHMPHMLPSLGYLAHLKCENSPEGDFEVIGAGFAGLPAIAFGTNGKVAWGATSNWADVSDLYVEKVFPGKPDHYEVDGRPEPFVVREEKFNIRQKDGSFETETLTVRETRHGVVINDFIDRIPKDFPLLALKRSTNPGHPIRALGNVYKSTNVTQARKAMNEFSVMVGHWALADSQGNIGYAGPLNLPKRTTHIGMIPVPGWNSAYEWDGFVPIEKLPYLENPASQWVGTANNQVIHPLSFDHPINFEGNVPFRVERIAALLDAGNTEAPIIDQLGRQQTDNTDAGWLCVKDLYLKAIAPLAESDDPWVAGAANMLVRWDGLTDEFSVGASVFQTTSAYILKQTMSDEISEPTLEFIMTYFNVEPLAYGIFSDPTNPAWDDRNTEKTETAQEVIAECFVQGVTALKQKYGEDMEDWTWNDVAPWEIHHAFGSQKALAKYLNREAPSRGSNTTIYKHQPTREELHHFPIKHGAVLRIMVDLNDVPGSRMSLPGGQSGRPASKHYDDQLGLFLEGKGVSMEMDFSKIAPQAAGTLVLKPAAQAQ